MKKIKNITYLTIIILISTLTLYFLKQFYIYISYKFYLDKLKNEFNKLRDLGLDIRNYDIYSIPEIDKKHIVDVPDVRKNGKGNIFKNKNAIGILLHNHIVMDFDYKDDINDCEEIRKKMPQNTVIEKTPHGYHYYFENDLNINIYSYVEIVINNKKYNIDILGKNNVVTMSPTKINNKNYYWLNSPYTHKFEKISNYNWILEFTNNNKLYKKLNRKINKKNSFIIINNFSLESEMFLHISEYNNSKIKIKFLHGTIYNFDNNYYFFTNDSFKKCINKKYLYNELFNLLKKLNPSCIINLSVSFSNEFIRNSIIQINNCKIHKNYNNYFNDYFNNYIKSDYLLINTNRNIENNVTIIDLHNIKNNLLKEKNTYCDESVYISILLSNNLQIPCGCFAIIINNDELNKKLDNETRNEMSNFFYSLF